MRARWVALALSLATTLAVAADLAERVNQAWQRVGELSGADKVDEARRFQRETASELWDAYLADPGAEAADQAVKSAFMMWANTGDADAIDAALQDLPDDSPFWADVLNSVQTGYLEGGRSGDEIILVLRGLVPRLSQPTSRSALFQLLGRDLVFTGSEDEARELFEEIVRLDADPFFVKHARGQLYEMDHLRIGQRAPSFAGQDLDGNRVSLADLRGKLVVLEFWSSTCGPCYGEFAALRRIDERSADQDVRVIGVSLDQHTEDARKVIESEKLDWPQLCDEGGFDGEIAGLYNVSGIPRAFVIDREGLIVAKDLRGEALEREVARRLEAPEAEKSQNNGAVESMNTAGSCLRVSMS